MLEKEILETMKKEDFQLYNQFIKAPASCHHHGAREGGLLEHSREVTKNLMYWKEKHPSCELTADDCHTCGMLHDLCKADLYKKVGDGYEYDRTIVAHHAKRSVEMIEKRLMIKLTSLQRVLILLHMSSWSNQEDFDALTTEDLDWLYKPNHIQLVQAMNWADMKADFDDK